MNCINNFCLLKFVFFLCCSEIYSNDYFIKNDTSIIMCQWTEQNRNRNWNWNRTVSLLNFWKWHNYRDAKLLCAHCIIAFWISVELVLSLSFSLGVGHAFFCSPECFSSECVCVCARFCGFSAFVFVCARGTMCVFVWLFAPFGRTLFFFLFFCVSASLYTRTCVCFSCVSVHVCSTALWRSNIALQNYLHFRCVDSYIILIYFLLLIDLIPFFTSL